MKVLGICGPIGSGKTTLAKLLAQCGWTRQRFATPIKLMLHELLVYQGASDQLAWEMLDGELRETPTSYLSGRTPRFAMQTLGTEWRDLIDQNLWVDAWTRTVQSCPDSSRIVIDDMRFIHEAVAVRAVGGKIARLTRAGTVVGKHPSEREYLKITADITIANDHTPAAMLDTLRTFTQYWT